MKRRWFAVSLLVVLVFLPLASCRLINKLSDKKPEKATAIISPSCFVKNGSWIYYIDPADQKLYKIQSDLSQKETIIDESINDPFFISDGLIYYVSLDLIYQSDQDIFKYTGRIYKAQLDGSGKILLEGTPAEISIVGLYAVMDDWIYFSKSVGEGRYLYRMKTDGSRKEKLTQETIWEVKISPDWIIYDGFKMKLDGSGKEKLSFKTGIRDIIIKDWIYYNNRSDGNRLYKYNINSEESVRLSKDGNIDLLAVDNGWIYYAYFSDNAKVYKVREDFSNPIVLTTERLYDITIIDDWIYYNLMDAGNKIFRMHTDGTGEQEVKHQPKYLS